MNSLIDLKLAKLRWTQQRSQCRNRYDKNGNLVEWKLSFDEWLEIWEKSGKWEQRGRGAGKYCMSRHNDVGPYEIGNVEIKLFSDNISEGQKGYKFPQKGRPGRTFTHSGETRKKISKSTKGRTPWNKGKTGCQIAWNKGIKMPEGTHWNLGKHHSEETKQKIRASVLRRLADKEI